MGCAASAQAAKAAAEAATQQQQQQQEQNAREPVKEDTASEKERNAEAAKENEQNNSTPEKKDPAPPDTNGTKEKEEETIVVDKANNDGGDEKSTPKKSPRNSDYESPSKESRPESPTSKDADSDSDSNPFSDPPPELYASSSENGSTSSSSGGKKGVQFHDLNAVSDSLSVSPDAGKKRERSKSIAVLEKISKKRSQSIVDVEHETEEAFAVAKYDAGEGKSKDNAEGAVRSRTRRLSSVFNEFGTHVETYLNEKQAKEKRKKSGEDSGSDSDSESTRNEFLQSIFDLLDQEKKGSISPEMLMGGFRKMGYQESNEKLNMMFQCADKNKDGVIDRDEFFSFFKELSHQDLVASDETQEDELMLSRRRSRAPSAFGVLLKNYKTKSISGLKGRIKTIATSPFRPLIAACDRDDKAIHLFDFNGTQLKLLQGHRDSMLGVAFSPDRKNLASASRDGTLVLWDCTVGHELGILQHPGVVTACAFSCDGKYIYTGCQDNLVRKYTVKKSRFVAVSERMKNSHLGVIVALGTQHHVDDEIVVSRSCDKGAIVMSASLKTKKTLDGHASMVWQASYNSDGQFLVTNCESIVKVWNQNHECIAEYNSQEFHNTPGVVINQRPRLWTTAQFGPPQFGPLLVMFNSDTNIFFVSVTNNKLILNLALRSAVYCASINDEMSGIVCGDEAGNITMIELK